MGSLRKEWFWNEVSVMVNEVISNDVFTSGRQKSRWLSALHIPQVLKSFRNMGNFKTTLSFI